MEEIFYLILVIAYFIIVIFLYKIINILIPTSKKKITGIKLNKEDKKICKKKVSYFRDIPCNGDIYEAYFIATLYNLNKRESDLLGAVLLKWILEGKISMLENKYINDDITMKGLEFLKEVIFNPNLEDNKDFRNNFNITKNVIDINLETYEDPYVNVDKTEFYKNYTCKFKMLGV